MQPLHFAYHLLYGKVTTYQAPASESSTEICSSQQTVTQYTNNQIDRYIQIMFSQGPEQVLGFVDIGYKTKENKYTTLSPNI